MISALNFKIGGGGGACADANVQNSDLSYQTTVASGAGLTLPDITLTEGDETNSTYPSAKNLVCKPFPIGATLMKTGQTTSYRTGDDGDLEAGRATNFTTLAKRNPFANLNRFTDELGGQTYTNNIVIDWSTYDGATVLGLSRAAISTGRTWNNAVDQCLAFSVGTFTSGWRLPNMKEIYNFVNFANDPSNFLNYSPLNLSSSGRVYWSSNTVIGGTTSAYIFSNVGMTGQAAKTTSVAYTYFPVRTFTVTGTTLT
ncbi:hypothetical protein UFOVP775_36 [uncultured Caudovirales phage]|uniref:DUF1566 domain-containing protein n=1 Tax=uncultured Caudovirales phage TaxID=2100421 RepID=A0A6J5NSR2_9CAUD|nr:hypothetical protein UFOVP775_36 [uncultured Caudovirales phage]